jgi:Ran GTPase-activating protein (RanGAP) involved in mRNA processing and transport
LIGCKITVNGATLLSNYLASPRQNLQELDIAFNNITATGAEEIASVLSMNKTLTSLNLRHNNIGIAGGEALCDAMEFNQNIRLLCIADNKVGTDVITLLAGRLRGGIKDVAVSVRSNELDLPRIYWKKERAKSFK